MLCCVLGQAWAQAPVRVPETAPLLLHEASLTWWHDESGAVPLLGALEAQAKGEFAPLTRPLGLGYVPGRVWLYFELERADPAPETYLLEVQPPFLDLLTLYTEDRFGAWFEMAVRGDTRSQLREPYPYRYPLFPLELRPGRQAFLLALESAGPLQGVFKLWPQATWQAETRSAYLALGFGYGVGFLFFFVNLSYWLVLRRSVFAVFAGWLVIAGLHWSTMDGLAAEFLLPSQPAWLNGSQAVLACLLTSASWAFFSVLFELKVRYPRFYQVAWVGIVLGGLAAVAALLGFYKVFAPVVQLYALLGFIPLTLEVRRLGALGGASRLLALTLAAFFMVFVIQVSQVMLAGGFSEYSTGWFVLGQVLLMLAFNIATSLRAQETRRETLALRLATRAAEREKGVLQRVRAERDRLLRALSDAIERPLARIQAGQAALARLSQEDGGLGPQEGARLRTLRLAAERLSLLLGLTAKAEALLPTMLRAERLSVSDWVFQALLLLPEGQRQRVIAPEQAEFLLFRGDRRLLSFALLNALENALRYSPDSSPVALRASAEPRGGGWVALNIVNEGPPLADADCEALFEKYAQAPSSRGKGGLGLGLFLLRSIIEAHGGKVSFRPGREEGVELMILLPKGAP